MWIFWTFFLKRQKKVRQKEVQKNKCEGQRWIICTFSNWQQIGTSWDTRVIYYGVLTRIPLKEMELLFVYLFSLVSITLLITKEMFPNYCLFKKQSNLLIKNFLVNLKVFLNTKCSLSLWSKLTIGHRKWFLNTNLFLITKFDCSIKRIPLQMSTRGRYLGGQKWPKSCQHN